MQAVLADPPDALELVGDGPEMRWVRGPWDREQWPMSKVWFMRAGEFGNEDWEWLLRHHDDALHGACSFGWADRGRSPRVPTCA